MVHQLESKGHGGVWGLRKGIWGSVWREEIGGSDAILFQLKTENILPLWYPTCRLVLTSS